MQFTCGLKFFLQQRNSARDRLDAHSAPEWIIGPSWHIHDISDNDFIGMAANRLD